MSAEKVIMSAEKVIMSAEVTDECREEWTMSAEGCEMVQRR